MSSSPARPGSIPELDKETQDVLEERLKTRDRDEQDGEDWTPEMKKRRIEQLKNPVSG